ncbi:MAG: DNA-directed RNA polymerase subunit beta [Candidatus Cloacimonetes bacterium]|nr:DNA-directed RNA polymerase subunit beta [Candidatus Cloacimonadota bacterium]MCF7814956.1 DNA-directed RNA polymerase subunit beta [Candidatus Cloacimonadota bacterium]MCF7869232.1 DNA-directed RNA polymerase subunit beta [Candidatus Cloacimonadota bacterium]MCF7884649.1 DNA-directed RNA polymerase subunit beta [Candidatus Cloacimonadota bacterium]
MQVDSFNDFLQKDAHPRKRDEQGLQSVLTSIFPLEDQKGIYHLEFIDYIVLKEKYSTDECIERNLSYQAPVKARMRLNIFDEEVLKESGEKRIKSTIEQDVFLGEIPLITERGTFIINGAERVIISQLHRSPGIFFSETKHASGKTLYSAKLIPYNGSWLEFTMDSYDAMFVLIDKRRKLPATILLRAIGLSTNDDLRNYFYQKENIKVKDAKERFFASDVMDKETGEIVFDAGTEIGDEEIEKLTDAEIKTISVIKPESEITRKILEQTIAKDQTTNQEEALKKIYTLIRPGEEPTFEVALELFNRMFFNERRYNLGKVGRHKLNTRLDLEIDPAIHILTREDFIAIIERLIMVYRDEDVIDDIDHLANRRVRTVGELMEEQFNIGLSRVARTCVERMSIANPDEVTIHDLINSNALIAVVQSFFLTGQLSQFMEQTNPLTAVTHMRRLSALGPGGLTRDRAGFEVRDVHYSHYGRICPIETPEGPNIGLISSPAMYSRINSLGFLETPYIKVNNGKITRQIDFLDSFHEERNTIAQANVKYNDDMQIVDKLVFARNRGEFLQVKPEDVQYMDVSPQQIVSVSAAMIPFLEHDDANRALMGSNMQRQAVPLISPEVPTVGTGMEGIVAHDSGVVAIAPYDGTVTSVTSSYIDIKRKNPDDSILDLGSQNRVYLKKFARSNQDTCINQRPTVEIGEKVKKGQILSDGPAIAESRLALGRNMLVAFMPWYGYNYEDAIILSENVAREDMLTSVYIEEHEVLVRNMKNGKEELAYDIPNVPTKSLRNLDKTGIIRVGSVVKAGDIIVGKITPKNVDIDPSPEENLMRALFGDRAGDFTNSSLKAKPGMEGVVIDVKVFSRLEGIDEVEEQERKQEELYRIKQEKNERIKRIADFLKTNLEEILIGQVAKNIVDSKTNMFFVPSGKKLTKADLKKINFKRINLDYDLVDDLEANQKIYNEVILKVKKAEEESTNIYKKAQERLKHGDELPYGVRKMVKVYIAKKRKIAVGDKMAGRHGNKGVISRISPIEDMPFMETGEAVDIILNPLGVPSRMNIGQIMETHLGMAARILGFNAETPVFDGATNNDILSEMKKAKIPVDGKQVLYDGKTGEPFRERVTVGVMYMLKLNHLVADKMHARSTGPYSLITQQPLGGKAQHGGQRLGEMEVWALEAYGASRLLEEMLTIKSDDVDGRTNAFKAITSGQNPPKPGIPESFNVLVSELKSLCFDVEFLADKE